MLKKIEAILGNVRFAVVILILFAVYLAVGTITESYHGTDYANRLIYKSIPFMLLQFSMFLSIYFATVQRFPYKKRLAGFYVLHLGLLLIFAGSAITYIAGIDGNLVLNTNTPNRNVVLNKDQLVIEQPNGKKLELNLPYKAFETLINKETDGLTILNYLPFADLKVFWTDHFKAATPSSQYSLYNDNFNETLYFSFHPQADRPSSLQLGPLSVHYLASSLYECFASHPQDKFIFWHTAEDKCYVPSNVNFRKESNLNNNERISISLNNKRYSFFPMVSPLPVNEKGESLESSEVRLFKKSLFEEKPHLFLFGESLAFFDKSENLWVAKKFEGKTASELPWMGFKIILEKHTLNQFPENIPVYSKPIQDNNEIISGNIKAIKVNFLGKDYWVTNQASTQIPFGDSAIKISLTQDNFNLPFEITLNQFHMDKDPGTNNPASYESYVQVFSGDKIDLHKIYMNNPMKKENFTFYQASFFQNDDSSYGSVLSVNYDPGRIIKYLGSLLLVFGSIYHFVIRRKK